MELDPPPSTLLPTPSTAHTSPPAPSLKVKDAHLPSFPYPSLSALPASRSLPKGDNLSLFPKAAREWSPPPPGSGKSGVPLITPVRGPDLRSVALYQSLLRHHPAYRQLLDTFLLPPTLPPLLCPPPAALCDANPFAFCAAAAAAAATAAPPPPFPAMAPTEEEKRRGEAQAGTAPSKDSPSKLGLRPCSPEGKTHGGDPPRSEDPCRLLEDSDSAKVGEEAAGRPGRISTEELVSSITAVPDPYQQYGYGRKLFPCPQCRYMTDRRNNLKRHMLTMHQLSAKLLECCGLLFRTKAALREHALVFHYHGYTCFYCARRFCRKALLKRHLSVHNGQKEFLCNVCDYATSHKSNLERHRRVHMRQDDDISGMTEGPAFPEDLREATEHLSEDEISVCSHEEENEEINVHSD